MAIKGPYRRQRDRVLGVLDQELGRLGFKRCKARYYKECFKKEIEDGVVQMINPGRVDKTGIVLRMDLYIYHKSLNDLYNKFLDEEPEGVFDDDYCPVTAGLMMGDTLPGRRYVSYDFDPDAPKIEYAKTLKRMLLHLHKYGIPFLNTISSLRGFGVTTLKFRRMSGILPYKAILAFALLGDIRAVDRVVRKTELELNRMIQDEGLSYKRELKELQVFARKARPIAKQHAKLNRAKNKPARL